MPAEVTRSSYLSPFSALLQSYGLNPPLALDAALLLLNMQSEDDLVRLGVQILDANPFGVTYESVRKHMHTTYSRVVNQLDIEKRQGLHLLVFLYVEYVRPFHARPPLSPTPLRLYGNHPTEAEETLKQWLARCRAYIVQYLRLQVEEGEIQTSAEHKRLFAQYTASVGDLKAGESVWYNLRIQTGAMELLEREKEAKEEARAQANREKEAALQFKHRRARDQEATAREEKAARAAAQLEAQAKAREEKATAKAANLAAMYAAWDKSREAKAQLQQAKAEAKAEAKRQAARKETTARYRANKKAQDSRPLTAPEHLRAAAGLMQTTQPQLAERLTAIASKLEVTE